jgi:putative acetyltransferase
VGIFLRIVIDDLTHPKVVALLQQHLDDMYATSPAESVHALDLETLRKPDISFWTVWQQQDLLGCGALKTLSAHHGEIKSMRTARQHLRKGVAAHLLEHIIRQAKALDLERLSLETGHKTFFNPPLHFTKLTVLNFVNPLHTIKMIIIVNL